MNTLLPGRFLVRLCLPCPYIKAIPKPKGKGSLLDLPESARLPTYTAMDGLVDFADVRLAWNELGLGVQIAVSGKKSATVGDISRPRSSDGLTLWVDTRDVRNSHRASRYCHQFHFLASGGGEDQTEPCFTQQKINRAQQDAPLFSQENIAFRRAATRGGYTLEAFLPAAVLTGFDPDQHPRLGVYYAVMDAELGSQYLAVSADFPIADDPSLWQTLELIK
jgi:hypothetical protein